MHKCSGVNAQVKTLGGLSFFGGGMGAGETGSTGEARVRGGEAAGDGCKWMGYGCICTRAGGQEEDKEARKKRGHMLSEEERMERARVALPVEVFARMGAGL
jgi:hypothetical protein